MKRVVEEKGKESEWIWLKVKEKKRVEKKSGRINTSRVEKKREEREGGYQRQFEQN